MYFQIDKRLTRYFMPKHVFCDHIFPNYIAKPNSCVIADLAVKSICFGIESLK